MTQVVFDMLKRPPPPSSRLCGLKILQPLPHLGRHEHDGLISRAHDGDRPAASFYLVGGRGQSLGSAGALRAHDTSKTAEPQPGRRSCSKAHRPRGQELSGGPCGPSRQRRARGPRGGALRAGPLAKLVRGALLLRAIFVIGLFIKEVPLRGRAPEIAADTSDTPAAEAERAG